jgi:hypothetical protein
MIKRRSFFTSYTCRVTGICRLSLENLQINSDFRTYVTSTKNETRYTIPEVCGKIVYYIVSVKHDMLRDAYRIFKKRVKYVTIMDVPYMTSVSLTTSSRWEIFCLSYCNQ